MSCEANRKRQINTTHKDGKYLIQRPPPVTLIDQRKHLCIHVPGHRRAGACRGIVHGLTAWLSARPLDWPSTRDTADLGHHACRLRASTTQPVERCRSARCPKNLIKKKKSVCPPFASSEAPPFPERLSRDLLFLFPLRPRRWNQLSPASLREVPPALPHDTGDRTHWHGRDSNQHEEPTTVKTCWGEGGAYPLPTVPSAGERASRRVDGGGVDIIMRVSVLGCSGNPCRLEQVGGPPVWRPSPGTGIRCDRDQLASRRHAYVWRRRREESFYLFLCYLSLRERLIRSRG